MMISSGEAPLAQVAGEPKEMLSASFDSVAARWRVRINFSSLSLMQECARKVQYSLIRKLRSNLESPATLFGSAIHKGLETFYLAPRTERKIPKGMKGIMDMIAAGAWEPAWEAEPVYAAARSFVIRAQGLTALHPDDKRSIESGVWILQHYFAQYWDDPFVVASDSSGPLVERKFSMPIHEEPGLEIEGFGQIDCVLKNEANGVILPCDHKTTSQLGPQFYQRLSPNAQYTFYSMAANRVLGLNTNNFLVNALQVKAVPKTARGTAPQFARQVTVRTEDDYEELKLALISTVKNHLRNLEADHWPQTSPGPCSNYGGCSYLDICSTPKQLRETVIRAKFNAPT